MVEFDLPGQPARSDSVTRVNDAFASWFVFAPGDPVRHGCCVEIAATR